MIRLTKRERLLSLAVAAFAALLSLYVLAVRPAVDRLRTLARLIPQKQGQLLAIEARSKEYLFLRNSFDKFRKQVDSERNGVQLLPLLESLVRESGLDKKLASMQQRVLPLESDYLETVVEVRLENLTFNQLIGFLAKVESSDGLARIKSLHIKTIPSNNDLVESVIEVHNARLVRSQTVRL